MDASAAQIRTDLPGPKHHPDRYTHSPFDIARPYFSAVDGKNLLAAYCACNAIRGQLQKTEGRQKKRAAAKFIPSALPAPAVLVRITPLTIVST